MRFNEIWYEKDEDVIKNARGEADGTQRLHNLQQQKNKNRYIVNSQ